MHTLLKRHWRSDALWTHSLLFRTFLKRIPFYFDTRALMRSQYAPRASLDALASARLERLMRDIAHIPFWSATFQKKNIDVTKWHADDFDTLPIISKKDFAEHKETYYTDTARMQQSRSDVTSGSTGRPFCFFIDRGYILRMYALCERMFRVAGGGYRLPIVSMRARERLGFAFFNYTLFFIRGYNSVPHRLSDLVQLATAYQNGFVLYAFVSPILALARLVRETKASLPLCAIIVTGEELKPEARRFVEGTFNVPVFACYTSQELGWLAFQCERGRLHLNEETMLIEIVDNAGKRCAPGVEGRVVVTSFENLVMPFVRYFNGDLGVIDAKPCPCGRTLRTIHINGRAAHLIELGDGRAVPLLDVSAIFDRFFKAILQYQIRQTDARSFTIKVVPGATFEHERDRLESMLVKALHHSVRIAWETVDDIPPAPSSKAIYFVNETLQ